DCRDHTLLPERRPVRHLEGHRPASTWPQVELGAGHPVRPLTVIQRDEGVEDSFRRGVDDAHDAELMPVMLTCRWEVAAATDATCSSVPQPGWTQCDRAAHRRPGIR